MTAPAEVLSIDHTFFVFFSFITDNCSCGSLFRMGINMKTFLNFYNIYRKIEMNVVKTISPWQ